MTPTRKATPVQTRAGHDAVARSTRQRRAIREVLESSERPLSPEEILAIAHVRGARVSLTTVYRSIRSFVNEGSFAVVELPGNSALYEIAGKAHHHHFACLRCQRVYELDGCVSVEALKLPRGFRALSHDLTISGTCAACGRSANVKAFRTGD